jgi:hypothetical protein
MRGRVAVSRMDPGSNSLALSSSSESWLFLLNFTCSRARAETILWHNDGVHVVELEVEGQLRKLVVEVHGEHVRGWGRHHWISELE